MYVCVRACVRACVHICMNLCIHACMYVCGHVCKRVCMYACLYAHDFMSFCLHVCMYSHMHVNYVVVGFDYVGKVRDRLNYLWPFSYQLFIIPGFAKEHGIIAFKTGYVCLESKMVYSRERCFRLCIEVWLPLRLDFSETIR